MVRRRQRMGIAPDRTPQDETAATAQEGPTTWVWGDGSRQIEAPSDLMEEIRAAVTRGALQLSHGGVEIAGLLLGEAKAHSVRILAWHTIPCRHRYGPSFRLDREEEEIFHELKDRAMIDAGPKPVGWFVVHSRRAAEITEEERAMTDLIFPEASALTFILKPVAGGEVSGRVYGRPAASVPMEELLPPFSLYPRPLGTRAGSRRVRTRWEQPAPETAPVAAAEQVSAPPVELSDSPTPAAYEIPLPGFVTPPPTFGDRLKLFLTEVFK